jgi:PRTRC genetic system protein F
VLKNFNHANKSVKKRRERGFVAATGYSATPFLTIPKLNKSIQASPPVEDSQEAWLNMAMLCASLVDDEFKVEHDATTQQIIAQTLTNWASKHCADIQVLDTFEIHATLNDELFGLERLEYKDANEQPNWYIALEANQQLSYFFVGEKLLELENIHCDLGHTAIAIAEQASFKTISALTPTVAKELATTFYWNGEETDADVLESAEDFDEDDIEDVFLPSHFEEAFPSVFLKGNILSQDVLQSIATSSANSMASEVASTILSMMHLMEEGAALPKFYDYDTEPVYFSCILGIEGDNNPITRVLDDHFQYANNSSEGYTSYYGVTEVPFEMNLFQKWREEMEKGFELYNYLDRLVRLIKKGD